MIGVNSQIESQSGGNVGIGFAVPSNTVGKIADALITDGSVEHAYLGVLEDNDGAEGATLGVRVGHAPAAEAGLEQGDVVTELDGESVESADELRGLVDSKSPGDAVELTIERDGDTQSVDVTLGTRPGAEPMRTSFRDLGAAAAFLGLAEDSLRHAGSGAARRSPRSRERKARRSTDWRCDCRRRDEAARNGCRRGADDEGAARPRRRLAEAADEQVVGGSLPAVGGRMRFRSELPRSA